MPLLQVPRLRFQVSRFQVSLPVVLASVVIAPVLAAWATLPAIAQPTQQNNVAALQTALQSAVCQNDWTRALQIVGMLVGSDEISADYRNQLMDYRGQLRTWREARASVAIANCPTPTSTAIPANNPSTATRPIDWNRAMESFNSGQSANAPIPSNRTAPRPTPTAPPNRRTPAANRPSRAPSAGNQEIARVQQCNQMADVVNPLLIEGDRFAQTVTPDNYLQIIPGLISRAENTNSQLRRLTLTDSNLRSYRQSLNSIYASLLPDVRNMVSSIRQGNLDNALRLRSNVLRLGQQESALLVAIIRYCSN